MSVFLAVLRKDLLIEWRSRDRAVAMLVFALLVVVVFHFSLPGGATARTQQNAPGLLWVAYVFASLFGLGRAFSLELENDALAGLSLAPVDRGWVFLGKATASLVILGLVQAVTAFAFAVVFGLDLVSVAPQLAAIALLGGLGLSGIGTLFSAIAVHTRFREVMLPLLLLPLLIPVLSGAVRATSQLLAEGAVDFEPLQLLLVTDGVYLIVSFLAFEFVLDE
ncbi:MAG: heme exporter protein CcmB [Myxococcota bacterium]|nr:heme exporter protein CcmB [Myxococcota bacterium]